MGQKYEGIFPYLEANNLAYNRSMGTGRRHKTLGLEQTYLLKAIQYEQAASSMSFKLASVFVLPTPQQVPWGRGAGEPRWILNMQ